MNDRHTLYRKFISLPLNINKMREQLYIYIQIKNDKINKNLIDSLKTHSRMRMKKIIMALEESNRY